MPHGNRYKFKLINGILSWKNDEMDRFMPVSPEILSRVILLYENEMKDGLEMWKKWKSSSGDDPVPDTEQLFSEFSKWMDSLSSIFGNIEPFRERTKWMDDHMHLN